MKKAIIYWASVLYISVVIAADQPTSSEQHQVAYSPQDELTSEEQLLDEMILETAPYQTELNAVVPQDKDYLDAAQLFEKEIVEPFEKMDHDNKLPTQPQTMFLIIHRLQELVKDKSLSPGERKVILDMMNRGINNFQDQWRQERANHLMKQQQHPLEK